MKKIKAISEVTYTCILSDEDMEKVYDYCKVNNVSEEDAILELFNTAEIDIYEDSTESECETQYVELID